MENGTVNVTNAFQIGYSAGASGWVQLHGGTINAGSFTYESHSRNRDRFDGYYDRQTGNKWRMSHQL